MLAAPVTITGLARDRAVIAICWLKPRMKPRKGDASMANTQGGPRGGEDSRRHGSGQQGGGQQGGRQDKETGQRSNPDNRKPSSGDTNRSDSGKTRDRDSEEEE
jgi:hypothetical protein